MLHALSLPLPIEKMAHFFHKSDEPLVRSLESLLSIVLYFSFMPVRKATLSGLKGWFVQSAPVDSGFAGDPTSPACDNILSHAREAGSPLKSADHRTDKGTLAL